MNGEIKKFYRKGLKFECILCGECCRLPNGRIEISKAESEAIANSLDLDLYEFRESYCENDNNILIIKENENHECLFLLEKRCTIYDFRPLQCRTFPFWPENLKSKYRWKLVKLYCPGIDDGPIISYEKIQEISKEPKEYYKDLKKKP